MLPYNRCNTFFECEMRGEREMAPFSPQTLRMPRKLAPISYISTSILRQRANRTFGICFDLVCSISDGNSRSWTYFLQQIIELTVTVIISDFSLESTRAVARRGTPYSGLHGEVPPERSVFFNLSVYLRVGKSPKCDAKQKRQQLKLSI